MSVESHGIPCSTSIYKWSDDGIYICDINNLFETIQAYFHIENMTLHVIKNFSFNNPNENKNEFYNLIGDELVPFQ